MADGAGIAAASVLGAAVSHADTARAAADELAAGLAGQDPCFVLVFARDDLDLDAFGPALAAAFDGVPVFGCTSAGQITPAGYETGATLAVAFPRAHFRCASQLIAPLTPLDIGALADAAARLDAQFQRQARGRRLALMLADGLSLQEEMLAATLTAALGDVPVFGGSAGDALAFRRTRILHGGRFHGDAAVLLLLETDLDVAGLGFDHFRPTERKIVVTGAVPEKRLVTELNGAPAAAEYARLVGCGPDELSPEIFAENPILARNNALYHVRAIRAVTEDGALSFMSAIDDGLILTLGQGTGILATLQEGLDLRDRMGRPPAAILGFDCILRRLEIEAKGLAGAASDVLRRARVLGFNTYGEQHLGVHVNQTFVGVAFFHPDPPVLS